MNKSICNKCYAIKILVCHRCWMNMQEFPLKMHYCAFLISLKCLDHLPKQSSFFGIVRWHFHGFFFVWLSYSLLPIISAKVLFFYYYLLNFIYWSILLWWITIYVGWTTEFRIYTYAMLHLLFGTQNISVQLKFLLEKKKGLVEIFLHKILLTSIIKQI